jgi:hypothetical protein
MARGSTASQGRAARSESVRNLTGRSIIDEQATGDRTETRINPQQLARLAGRYANLDETTRARLVDLRGGYSSSEDRNNNISIYADMLEKGLGKDELFDPRSPFNLENIKASITNQAREFAFKFDKDGRLISWARGNKGSVRNCYLPGSGLGGVDIHNHPVDDDRPLGLSFSDTDIRGYHQSGVALGIVYTREGEYRVKFPAGFDKKFDFEVSSATRKYDSNLQLIWKATDKAIAMGTPKDRAYMVAARMFNDEADKMAKVLGFEFEFIPAKGYEWIANKSETPPPAPPAFQTASSLRPHKDNFKPPAVVTARGFTIVGARDLKAPRKPRTPKVKPEPEPAPQPSQPNNNNNYFRL